MFTKDTIRLCVQFRDMTGRSIVPENIKLTIYKSDQSLLEEITEGIIDNSDGNFHFDYVAPEHSFIYEFSGVHNNKPVLARQEVEVKFI